MKNKIYVKILYQENIRNQQLRLMRSTLAIQIQ